VTGVSVDATVCVTGDGISVDETAEGAGSVGVAERGEGVEALLLDPASLMIGVSGVVLRVALAEVTLG
jgi:hypothetical protein